MPKQTDLLTRAEPNGTPTSWNAETRTLTVTLSAFAPVARFDARGEYDEVLSPGQVWPAQVPFLDSHNRSSLDDQLGFVSDIRIENGLLVGTAKLSKVNERAIRLAAELDDGATFGISIGYRVAKAAERKNPTTNRREIVATQYTLLEASAVSIPSDAAAGTRSTPDLTTENNNEVQTIDRAPINASIRSIAKVAGLDDAWANVQIDAGATEDVARTAAFAAMTERSAPLATISNTQHNANTTDNPTARRGAMAEAIFVRANPTEKPSDAAKPFLNLTTLDLARETLRSAGISTTGLSVDATFERALHTTSDFPIILGDGINRSLRAGYTAVPSALKQLGRQKNAKDFKLRHSLSLGEAPSLEKVNEAGEFKSGTMTEAGESYKIDTYGRIFSISRQALINDDLNAFGDLARKFGNSAAAREAQLIVDLLVANSGLGPVMSDTKNLFHADHKNIGTAAVISKSSISAARIALQRQVGISGELIDVKPKYLVVPPELQTVAEEFLATINATKSSDVNVFAGSLTLIVEPRLLNPTRWYVVADPASIDTFEFAYLEGAEGIVVETRAGWEIDGVSIKARLDVGAGWVEHRGIFTNAGAAPTP